MKVLLDSCLSGETANALRAAGFDVVWTGDWPTDPGDSEILAAAHAEKRIVATLDKDFGQLAIAFRHPHSGIVRLVDQSVARQTSLLLQVLVQYGSELEQGAVVTVDPARIRIRPPDPVNS